MKPIERTSVPDAQAEITQRLRTAAGRLAGVIRMAEEAEPCAEVLQQLLAVQGALRATARLLLTSEVKRSGIILQEDPDAKPRPAELQPVVLAEPTVSKQLWRSGRQR